MERRKLKPVPVNPGRPRHRAHDPDVNKHQRRKPRAAMKLLLRLPPELYQWLKDHVHQIGSTMTSFINYLLVLERVRVTRKEPPND